MGGWKISSLEDKALTQVAINLCQEYDFKEVAMCLEKPTYGGFINRHKPFDFVCDPEKLSTWAKVKEDARLRDVFMESFYWNDIDKVRQWDAAIDEQCQRLTKGMPPSGSLRQKVHAWVNRIALEYLSYSRRQERLFRVSRYLLINILTRGDWKESGQLDEKKLAQRLLEDEHLTVLQKYRIACVYCLHVHIAQLWKKLTQEEKYISGGGNPKSGFTETNSLVLLWSHYVIRDWEDKTINRHLWELATFQATAYGNCAALMLCWKKLEELQPIAVINRALESLRQWQHLWKRSYTRSGYKERLVLNYDDFSMWQAADSIRNLNLPSYHSELMYFFLSQMDHEQLLTFFRKAFQSGDSDSVLECFLDWPHQDDFLPTIKWLWEVKIIPKDKYGQCLLALASKYSGNDEKENRYYDYQSLLKSLWKDTPEEYKQYVFDNKQVTYLGKELLYLLLKRSPFQKEDEALFKQIFCYQPQEERRAMMHSEMGRNICLNLMQKEKWSFVDRLLGGCLSKEEISSFKKEFIQSKCGQKLCLDALENDCERLVEDLINWSFDLDAEKKQCTDELRYTLISRNTCLDVCKSLLRKGKFADVERVIKFCLSSDENREQFKVHCAQYACSGLLEDYKRDSRLEDCVWEQMDAIIAWSFDTEEKIRDFKENLFSREKFNIHYCLVFIKKGWGKVEHFYQMFGLDPEEIKQIKKDTLFASNAIQDIHEDLPKHTNTVVASLGCCLTDEEMVIDLKKGVEEECFKTVLDEREQKEKEQLDNLMNELLDGVRKEEVLVKTSSEAVFVKDTGEKKSFVEIEGNSSSRKRCKLRV